MGACAFVLVTVLRREGGRAGFLQLQKSLEKRSFEYLEKSYILSTRDMWPYGTNGAHCLLGAGS